jgi:hypothetical protein
MHRQRQTSLRLPLLRRLQQLLLPLGCAAIPKECGLMQRQMQSRDKQQMTRSVCCA